MPRKSQSPATARSIEAVIHSWDLALQDEHKTPRTRALYLREANLFAEWLAGQGATRITEITPDLCRTYRNHLIERGLADTTRNLTHRTLSVFLNFAVAEGDLDQRDSKGNTTAPGVSPLAGLKAPKIDTEKSRRFHVPKDDELDKVFAEIAKDAHRLNRTRDTAILALFLDTGLRLGELTNLQKDDIDLSQRMAHASGKTGYRAVRFSPRAARALDRYLIERERHFAASEPWLWLARAGRMTDSGISQMIRDRARAAGISRLHPHALRHRFASQWLREGGSETDLQWLAGWRSGQMVRRYSDYDGSQRALDAYDRVLGRG